MKIATRLIIHILLSLTAVVVPVSLYQLYSLLKNSYQESYTDNLQILKSFNSPVAEALWSLDDNYMKQLTTSIILSGSINRVEIYNEDLKLFWGLQKGPDQQHLMKDQRPQLMPETELSRLRMGQAEVYRDEQNGPLARVAIPIISAQGPESEPSFRGVLAVEYSLKSLNHDILYRILENAGMITIFTLVMSLILFYSLKRSVVTPLFDLLKAMRLMPSDRTVRLSPQASHTTEFARIYETFNDMVEDLEGKDNVINEQRKQMIQSSKMSALGEMAAGIAHEINNPLAIIVGYNHIVRELVKRDESDKSEILRNLNKIQETTDRISKIIQGLKTFSRNSTTDARKWVPLSVIVVNTLEFCSQRFKNHGIDLILDPIPPLELFCRDSQMIQVLLNLLNNSFDAVQELPDQSWIRLGFVVNKDLFSIQVTDSGPGIPTGLADKIMQPFFTTKEVGKGTGLGLSISKGIVDEHAGQLRFNRHSPQTQFLIEFPNHLLRALPSPNLKNLDLI